MLIQQRKILYLYCDSNPIQRKDDDGKILHCVLVGAASAAFGMITTIATNIVTDEKMERWLGRSRCFKFCFWGIKR